MFTSDSVTLYVHSFSHIGSDLTQAPTFSAKRKYCWPGLRGWLLEDLSSTNRNLHHATQSDSSVVCGHITPNIWPLNYPDCSPFNYYVWGTVERETYKTLCNTKNELKAKIPIKLTNWIKETLGKACRKFRSRLGAVVEADGEIFENISRYFHEILAKISDKGKFQLFLFLLNLDDNLLIATCKSFGIINKKK